MNLIFLLISIIGYIMFIAFDTLTSVWAKSMMSRFSQSLVLSCWQVSTNLQLLELRTKQELMHGPITITHPVQYSIMALSLLSCTYMLQSLHFWILNICPFKDLYFNSRWECLTLELCRGICLLHSRTGSSKGPHPSVCSNWIALERLNSDSHSLQTRLMAFDCCSLAMAKV